ncbi:unnamed protein product [Rhizoctonia solani]|uniref:Uncharacterized protein n=1 Tax=Rhizoctonia solani TaxID=456999 RepID=A0A8H3GJZ0_9AGAM|nr:unnamed protein product [Rhizoctonia solani]
MPKFASLSSAGVNNKRMKFFSDWGEGPVFDWYRALHASGADVVDRLQIRVENNGIPHRFVVAFLPEGKYARFDRRPLTREPGPMLVEAFGVAQAREAADDYDELTDAAFKTLEKTTTCEMNLKMPSNTTLLHIISACFSLSRDSHAGCYHLLKYNCYFFSWTVVMIVSRHTHQLLMPSPTRVVQRLTPKVKNLTESLTSKVIERLLDAISWGLTVFREKFGRKLDKGLGKRELFFWKIPIATINWVLRLFFTGIFRSLHGAEKTLRARIEDTIKKHLVPVITSVLNYQSTATEEQIKQRLWVDDFSEDFRDLIHGKILQIFWSTALETLAADYGRTKGEQLITKFKNHPKLSGRLKYHICGKNILQIIQMLNDGLIAAMFASRDKFNELERSQALPSDPKEMLKMVFEEAFKAGNEASALAAQEVIENTRDAINNPLRDDMWKEVWAVWDDIWVQIRTRTHTMIGELVDQILTDMAQIAVLDIMEEIRGGDTTKAAPANGFTSPDAVTPLIEIQKEIHRYIRSAPIIEGSNTADVASLHSAMTRAWIHSRDTYKPLTKVM